MSEVQGSGWEDELRAALGSADIDAEVTSAFADTTVTVAASTWVETLTLLRDDVGLVYFDWLSAVDEGAESGFTVFCHLYAPTEARHVLVRTLLPRDRASIRSATGVFAGAAWHERETHEMFGIDIEGHPHLVPLLLPDEFVGHPLRKDFVLTARVSKSWPGAKEPGESGDGSPGRRKMQPPGVPDPEWGPRDA